MREPHWLPVVYWVAMGAIVVIMFTGCQGGPSRRTLASAEPTLSPASPSGTAIAEGVGPSTPRAVTFVDRHPLFSRPREYYDNSGSNKVVKTAAAVVVGVPAGIFGELKQIVVGAPPESHF